MLSINQKSSLLLPTLYLGIALFKSPLHSRGSARDQSTLFLLSIVRHRHRGQCLSASPHLLAPVALVLQDIAAKAILGPPLHLPLHLFWRRMALLGGDEL